MTRNIKRRNFIRTSAKGVAAVGLLSASSCAPEKTDTFSKLFIHHVFFWLKEPLTPEVRTKFEKSLSELVKVETIVDHHLGIPAPTDRAVIDTSYSYSLLVTFKTKEDQDVYQTHDIHLKFIADCQDLWEKVVVYDSISI
jgi:hypothetical protein